MISAKICHPILLPLLCALLSSASLRADEPLTGEKIYSQQCASCHGDKGEGVKGEYDDPLQGDWSLAKLTRVIAKTMPEDEPDDCTGPDAEAVAQYIYDAFYSREARERNQPARIELARLTNRQYLNTVADLIGHFAGGNPIRVGERGGLRAGYFDSRNFGRGKKVEERVESTLNFDFGEGSPDPDKIKPEEFSIQWRGSILPEETGDYEFILTTPNGARLFVNEEQKTLIDAWVSLGVPTEHRATVRLIAGRAYPIRLEFFKFKEKAASISLQWKAPHRPQEFISARYLSPQSVPPTFIVTTAFPPDDSSVGYERGVSVSKAWDEATTQAAIEAADYVVQNLDALSGSKRNDPDRGEKIRAFCENFVAAAFRRPLNDEERQIFVEDRLRNLEQPAGDVKRLVLLALKSPRFLYPNLTGGKADQHAVAARLAFGLWDSLPDAELSKAAAEGRLATQEQVAEQANRMLADPRTRAKVHYFLQQWLQMNHAEDFAKDETAFPGFTAEIVADLRSSLNLFLEDVVWNEGAGYRGLLLAESMYLNDRLAKFYGVELQGGGEFEKVAFDPAQRSGVVTHPYLLAAFSYQKTTSPIHRGVFLTRSIVGRALKPPKVAVEFNDSEFDPHLTMREKVEELTRSSACQSCHSVINPLGFSLEHYDAVGRFRTEDNAQPVNAISEFLADDGQAVRFTGARDVAQFAAADEQAQNGFIEQLFHQVVKQPILAYGRETPTRLRQRFIESEYNIPKLLVEIAVISALHGSEASTLAQTQTPP